MKVRLGYACISETLSFTSSSSYSYTSYEREKDNDKLDKVIVSNFLDLEQILIYNAKNNIHFYRLSSGIIPLATHSKVHFDYTSNYKEYYDRIGSLIKNSNMRVDFHPNQYCILNSVNKEVVNNSVEILKYHYNLLEKFGVEEKVLILHIGSNAFGKNNSLTRFINNFKMLPKYLQDSIVIENDDKIFNVEDCLYLSDKLGIPVCFDYHHYICNKSFIDYKKIFATFKGKRVKMHFSSPKNKTKKEFRSHNDYIDSDEFIKFLESIKNYNIDIDIMIEAKKKDEAMFKLVRELKYKTDYNFIDETSFII